MAVDTFVDQQSVTNPNDCAHLEPIIREIQQSIDADSVIGWHDMPADRQQSLIDAIYCRHVAATCHKILERSTTLSELVRSGRVKVVGAMYDVHTGRIDFFK